MGRAAEVRLIDPKRRSIHRPLEGKQRSDGSSHIRTQRHFGSSVRPCPPGPFCCTCIPHHSVRPTSRAWVGGRAPFLLLRHNGPHASLLFDRLARCPSPVLLPTQAHPAAPRPSRAWPACMALLLPLWQLLLLFAHRLRTALGLGGRRHPARSYCELACLSESRTGAASRHRSRWIKNGATAVTCAAQCPTP